MRRAEVVAAGLGVRQELLSHHGAHHVGPLCVTSIVTLSYQFNVDQQNFTHYTHYLQHCFLLDVCSLFIHEMIQM